MGNWNETPNLVDPRTGESLCGGSNTHEAREQRLRNIEATRRLNAGDEEGASMLLRGKDPETPAPPVE